MYFLLTPREERAETSRIVFLNNDFPSVLENDVPMNRKQMSAFTRAPDCRGDTLDQTCHACRCSSLSKKWDDCFIFVCFGGWICILRLTPTYRSSLGSNQKQAALVLPMEKEGLKCNQKAECKRRKRWQKTNKRLLLEQSFDSIKSWNEGEDDFQQCDVTSAKTGP